jgi:CheY-like chemotaxis protein/glycine cleavage system H lipoate-binding protein
MESNIKILVVDDEIPVCKSICTALESHEYLVDMAYSGSEALKKDQDNHYDVIVADLMMPEMSGMDLLQKIKEDRPEVQVILVTGYPAIKTAVEAIKLGAFDYIPKPFTPSDLRSAVARALGKKDLIGKNHADAITIPKGLYCISSNSWAFIEEDGNVRVGVHHAYLRTIKKIISFEFPERDSKRYQGEAIVRIIDSNHQIHRIWAPVSGIVIEVNSDLNDDFSSVLEDPYKKGWLIKLNPLNLHDELKNLVLIE